MFSGPGKFDFPVTNRSKRQNGESSRRFSTNIVRSEEKIKPRVLLS